MVEKWIIFGCGSKANGFLKLYNLIEYNRETCIVAFVDNNPQLWGGDFHGYPIVSPADILSINADYICIWSSFCEEIKKQLITDLGVPEYKVKNIFYKYLEDCKYTNHTENLSEGEIRKQKEFLNQLMKSYGISVYGYKPAQEHKLHEVYYDEIADLNWVEFEGKKMYLKRGYELIYKEGKAYVSDFWKEQDDNSPHKYCDERVFVKEGDVLLDGGTCEGNFTLHNIDKIKKAYIVECNPDWVEALQYTFAPYKDKVVICNRYLSDVDSESQISIDSLVKEELNFLKLDIEGAERKALQGGKNSIQKSRDFRCSICTYHRTGDEEYVTDFLNDCGVTGVPSEGYMLFLHDPEIKEKPQLRRGVVRGIKKDNTFNKII